jgi:hypothetical protein
MQIVSQLTFGGLLPSGIVNIPYNVDPTAKVAGTDSVSLGDLRKYNFFNVTSAAATANITIGSDVPVGSQFVLYVGANGMELLTEGSETMNGGTSAQVIDIAANASAVVLKTSATTLVVEQVVAAGTRTAPVPAIDG